MYTIAIQGIKGSYSEEALINYSQKIEIQNEIICCESFEQLFDSIQEHGLGFVPIENSTAGSVTQSYDLLLNYDVEIIGEYIHEIKHCLLGIKGSTLGEIKEVYSHPQAIMQCSEFSHKHNFTQRTYFDTAGAAELIAKKQKLSYGSYSSKLVAKQYDLEILAENIANTSENFTRFLLVKKKGKHFDFEKEFNEKNKSTLFFETKHSPGDLYKCLGTFANNGVNLMKIESRPSKSKNFTYVFHVDIQDTLESQNTLSSLKDLENYAKNITLLGSYKEYKRK